MNSAGEVVSVEGVSVSLAGRPILQNVAFTLREGEFCGLIGPNGAGKTTLLRTLLGLQKPSAGRIRFAGRNGRPAVGYVPQKILLDPYFPLRTRDLVALGFDGRRLGIPLPSSERRSVVAEMLRLVDAARFAERRVGELSGGEQQRALIAHALIRRPPLLLLDEPLAGLDIRSAAEVADLVRRLSLQHRIAVLVSAHDMNPLLGRIDRIVYLANGRAISGRIDEVVRTGLLSRLYGYHVDVIRVHGRVLVVAGDAAAKSSAVL